MDFQLCAADSYEALQINEHVVLIGKGKHHGSDHLPYFEKASIGNPQCTLYHGSGSSQTVKAPSVFQVYTAFDSPSLLTDVLVKDMKGVHSVSVQQHPKGILKAGGGELQLPILSASAPFNDAIQQMKVQDKRAVLVTFNSGAHELFMNYQIARYYGEYASLGELRGRGQSVQTTQSFHPGSPRLHLFSIIPSGIPMARVVTLFESVASSVATVPRVCLCSTGNHKHTVTEPPGVDKSPCIKAPPNHGIYSCF